MCCTPPTVYSSISPFIIIIPTRPFHCACGVYAIWRGPIITKKFSAYMYIVAVEFLAGILE
eukprot:m.351453 g.351453  ORF g.351453 m.351453 type:complete len:61 (+) comp16243_c0_seq1:1766-1948(+)